MNSDPRTVTVFGATGNVGGQAVRQLSARGIAVRAVGRSANRLDRVAALPGVTPVVADMSQPDSLRPSLDGADAVFLVVASGQVDDHATKVARLAGADDRPVAYLSMQGLPEDPTGQEAGILGSHVLWERAVGEATTRPTFVRGSGFATNTLGWADQIRAGDDLRWFGPGIRRTLVHEADLAAVGVLALTEDGHAGAVYNVSGPEQISQEEQLMAIGAALGRSLRFVDVGEQGAVNLFTAAGTPEDLARAIVEGQLALAEHPETVAPDLERLLGRPGTSYAQWAVDHVDDFR